MNNYLVSWGSNANNQLLVPFPSGLLGGTNSNLSSGGQNVRAISLGKNHGLAQFYDQSIGTYITGWGNNNFNQYSIKNNFIYKNFEAGDETSYLVDTVGRIHVYGKEFSDNYRSYTGNLICWFIDTPWLPKPAQSLLLYPRNFEYVSAGSGYVLALNISGKITGWGNSGHPVINSNKLLEINNKGFVTGIAAGDEHALALFNDGSVTGWGNNSFGQLNFNNQFFFSGVKISTKGNYNLMMGLVPPIITGAASGTGISNWLLKYTRTGSGITGVHVEYSLDRSNWVNNVFSASSLNNNTISGNAFPSNNADYYIRMVEFISGGRVQKTGSTTLFNPALQKFNIYNDYRVYTWPDFTFETDWEKNLFWTTKITSGSANRVLNNILFDRDSQNQILDYGPQILQSFDSGHSWLPQTVVSFKNRDFTGSCSGYLMSLSPGGSHLSLTFPSFITGIRSTGTGNITLAFKAYNPNQLYYAENLSTGNFRIFDERTSSFINFTGINLIRNTSIHSSTLYTVMINETGSFVDPTRNRGSGELILFRNNLDPNANFTGYFKTGVYRTGISDTTGQRVYWESAKIINNRSVYGIIRTENNQKFLCSLPLQTREVNLFSGRLLNIPTQNKNWLDIDISENGLYQTALEQNGYIYTSANSGITWAQANYISGNWSKVTVSKNGQFQGVIEKNGTNGDVILSKDYGQTWTKNNFSGDWKNLAVSNSGLFAIVDNSGLYYKSISVPGNLTEILSKETINDISAGYNYHLILTERGLPMNPFEIESSSFSNQPFQTLGATGSFFTFSGLNEVYYFDQTYNGKPSYKSNSLNLIRWVDNRWNIYFYYKNLAFFANQDTLYPWEVLRDNWVSINEYGNFGKIAPINFQSPASCTGLFFDS